MIVRIGWQRLFRTRRSRTALLLCLLALAAVGLDIWQQAAQRAGGRTWFDNAIATISYPTERALVYVTSRFEHAWRSVARGHQLARENVRLAARVAALESEVVELEEVRAQGDRERALIAAYSDAEGAKRLAHVIGVGSGGWLSYLVVDRGSADGVRQRDVAATRGGVVGQVYAVTTHAARILPLTDPASGMAVRVQRSRETGILKGLGDWRCEVRYLDPDADVMPGDQVLTSGTGGVFPKGLRVGTVISVQADAYTPGMIAAVEPVAELRRAEEVILLRPEDGEPSHR